MPEETTVITEEAPVPIVGADGTFAPNWRDGAPDDLKGEKALDVIEDFWGGIRQTVNAQKLIGADKVVLPGPNATDEERNEFYKAIGALETPGDYKITVPEELKDRIGSEEIAKIQQKAHALHATQGQLDAYLKDEFADILQANVDAKEQQAVDKQNAIDEMRKRFAGAFDERMHIANRLIAEICKGDANESRKIALLEAFGNNPDFIEFASDCGAKLVEHKALIAEMTHDTPKEALAKLAELRATPGFTIPDEKGELLQNTNPAKKKAIMAEIEKLTYEAYPETRPKRPGQ